LKREKEHGARDRNHEGWSGEKKGSGVSVPVEAFEGKPIFIFVDEGHKGASSEAGKWIGNRDKLAGKRFSQFEYSADVCQAMTAARDERDDQVEYGKAILVDYGYKYFYGDGFGRILEFLNLTHERTSNKTRTLLLANLLAFHEQKRAFPHEVGTMARYSSLPIHCGVFVGSTVNK